MSTNLKNIFKESKITPQIFMDDINNITGDNLKNLEQSCLESISLISKENFNLLFI